MNLLHFIKYSHIEEIITLLNDKYKTISDIYDLYEKIQRISIEKSVNEDIKDYQQSNEIHIKNIERPSTNLEKECILLGIRTIVDQYQLSEVEEEQIETYKEDYKYYPDYKESDFDVQIMNKLEFNQTKISLHALKIEDKCGTTQDKLFELSPHQLFLKNFISDKTPYRSLLLFHGVGTGKTCSGVSIAENFKDIYSRDSRKIIILSSKNIQIGWKNTIFNPSKGDNQCSGDTYSLVDENNPSSKILNGDKKASKLIKTYYNLYGYLAFANYVKGLLKDVNKIPEDNYHERMLYEKKVIKKIFSNRVLIIDEVHNIRGEDSGEKMTRDTIIYIEKVIEYSDNLKLILLTANPMYNQANEIIWILNMMLLNDGRPILYESQIFDTEGSLSLDGIKLLQNVSRGYISYVRGENPITFPLRLYPTHNMNMIYKDKSPSISLFNTEIEDKISILELYGSMMNGFQKQVYMSEVKKYDGFEKIRIQPDEGKLLQLSNIVYPAMTFDELRETGEIENVYGDRGFDSIFQKSQRGKNVSYSYRKHIIDQYGPILDTSNLGNYSAKMKSIIRCINMSDGILFIYTNYIKSGIMPLLLALEHEGYEKYGGQKILHYPEYKKGQDRSTMKKEPISYNGKRKSHTEFKTKEFHRGRYMVISGGGGRLSSNFEEELKIVTSEDNKYGQHIKIIIGTSVASEGLDFKYLRGIHVLEPWHNLNKIEQVIGRGIRYCSHSLLLPEERNVSIYLHTSCVDDMNNETIDSYVYRLSEKKSIIIGDIETILKQNAIDRRLFRDVNIIQKKDGIKQSIKPCYRQSSVRTEKVSDYPYSRVCSFQKECNYLEEEDIIEESITMDTFEIQFSRPLMIIYQKRIEELFKLEYSYTFETLIHSLEEYIDISDKHVHIIIYYALEEMILSEKIIYDKQDKSGYIVQLREYYVFQPLQNRDITLSLYYRQHYGQYKEKEYVLDKPKVSSEREPIQKTYETYTIATQLELLCDYLLQRKQQTSKGNDLSIDKTHITIDRKTIDILVEIYTKYKDVIQVIYKNNLVDRKIIHQFIFDRLSFDYKCELMSWYISNIGDPEIIQDYNLDYLLITYDGSIDEYSFHSKKNIYGCMIYHTDKREIIYLRCDKNGLYECNMDVREEIEEKLKLYEKESIYYPMFSDELCSYLVYNEKRYNNFVLKVKRLGQLKGTIINDDVPGWWLKSTKEFCEDDLQDYWNTINVVDHKKLLKSKSNLVLFIELTMMKKNKYIPYDIANIFSYIR